jgi:hypothetical protein
LFVRLRFSCGYKALSFLSTLKKVKSSVIVPILITFLFSPIFAQTEKLTPVDKKNDQVLAEKLKQELNFNMQRRKGFKKQIEDQKFFDREREKGLALFLEEQEKFDIEREKGIAEHKKSKTKSLDESSPEYFSDLKEKKNRELWLDQSRKVHINTRDQIVSQYSDNINQSESQELDLYNNRPRYDLRKRHNNKWVKNSTKSSSSSSGNSFNGAPSPENSPDFPPPMDYAPQPIDNFEEIPPPPPAIPFDQSQGFGNGFDSGFGDAPMPPPPPPPPEGGWDF